MPYRTYLKATPTQGEKAKPEQVMNNAGGYVFKISLLKALERFIILGTIGGTYYQGEREITKQNLDQVTQIMADPELAFKAIDLTVNISAQGRAFKNDPALVVLAIATTSPNLDVRKYAMARINLVARIPTHLFHLVTYRESFGAGWGRAFRNAIADWYNLRPVDQLAFQMAKYQSRDGWSHKDMLKLAHPKPADNEHNILYRWALGNKDAGSIGAITGLEKANKADTEEEIVKIINEYKLPFEMVPTKWLKSVKVWDALLPNLGYTAVLRSLGRMAQAEYLVPGKFSAIAKVIKIICNCEQLKKSKTHPLQILSALKTYASGHGVKSDANWPVCQQVVDALNEVFYDAFNYIPATGKRFYLAVDCSGSMDDGEIGVPGLCPRDGAAILAMSIARAEQNYIVRGFSSGTNGISDLLISPRMELDKVVETMADCNWGGTDCALPMIDAANHDYQVDTFVVITDNETWAGRIHPYTALKTYRQKTGINAKLIVIGMTATNFSIADPSDPGMLDLVGFDMNGPKLVQEFALDNI